MSFFHHRKVKEVYRSIASGARNKLKGGGKWEGDFKPMARQALKKILEGRMEEWGSCQLIATDGGTGLHAALEIVYPKTPLQRCWAHKTRNVLDKVKKKDREAVKKALQKISHAKVQVFPHGSPF
ncbi:MAG: transposase [Deltaproteobacteria bacterium]|nr:transposase [Deltaproteobacteria bacterium]